MPDTSEASDYWLSEGFTDFFTFRLLVTDSIWTIAEYLSATNQLLSTYARSPVRTVPNSTVVTDFWKSGEMNALPYQRGFLLATIWDERLRAQSSGRFSLDSIVLDMRRAARTRPDSLMPLARAAFVATMKRYGIDPTADIERYVERGEPILLPAVLTAVPTRVITQEVPGSTSVVQRLVRDAG
jgi:predicted metalloprotease with PDZ domain